MYYTVSTYVEKNCPGNFLPYAFLITMGQQNHPRLIDEQTVFRYNFSNRLVPVLYYWLGVNHVYWNSYLSIKNHFWFFPALLRHKEKLALYAERERKNQKWIFHRKLRVQTSEGSVLFCYLLFKFSPAFPIQFLKNCVVISRKISIKRSKVYLCFFICSFF